MNGHRFFGHGETIRTVTVVGHSDSTSRTISVSDCHTIKQITRVGGHREVYRLASKSIGRNGDDTSTFGSDYRRDVKGLGIVGINLHFFIRHDEGVNAGLRIVGIVQYSQIGTVGHLHLV